MRQTSLRRSVSASNAQSGQRKAALAQQEAGLAPGLNAAWRADLFSNTVTAAALDE
jgi:hypothetical protein